MKHPKQCLIMHPEWHEMCESGAKKWTVRLGQIDYRLEKCVLTCEIMPWSMPVDIDSVMYGPLKLVPKEVYRNEGFHSLVELKEKLEEYYPDITMGSTVTMIHWEIIPPLPDF